MIQRGRGFAFSKYKNLACCGATVADVEVDRKTGRVSVTGVVAAVDAGPIVNPDGVINQIEGASSSRRGAQGPAAAAIANGIANATGKRLWALPVTAERVKQALA